MLQRGIHLMAGKISELRRQNERENKWYGDNLASPKSPKNIRMAFHNIRGLTLKGAEGLEMFIHEQSTLEIDLQAFSEHCLDTTKFYVQQEAKNILRSTYQGPAMIQLSSSEEPAPNQYKPGGTGILILGQTTSKLEPNGRGSDNMGRWSYVHLRRKNLPPVTVISVYQVCPRPTNPIGNTAYHQQQRILNSQNRTLHPRKAFMQDLDTFLHSLRALGHDIVVGGDFNESLEDKNSGLLSLTLSHRLIDVFMHRFPHHSTFGTHLSGTRRIDSVFVTERIVNCVSAMGYAPFDFASTSDHRSIMIEFTSDIFFGKATIEVQHPNDRGVKTNDITMVTRFVNSTYQQLHNHQAFRYQKELDDDTATPQLVEMLDAIIGKSEDNAEKKCHRRRPEFYSRTIVQQRLAVTILQGHLNALKQNKDRTHQLRQKMKRTGIELPLPLTQHLTNKALREARKQLQETTRVSFSTRQAELSMKIVEAQQEGDQAKTKVLKAMKKVEEGRRTYRILKALRSSSDFSSRIDRIEIPASWPTMTAAITEMHQLEDPKTCTAWRTVTEPSEIEYYLMLRNRLHFGQAEGTPFTTAPLCDDINWEASTPTSDQILQGEHCLSDYTDQIQCLLAACAAHNPLNCIPAELTLEDFRGKLKSWRESTTTSPSGRHLGRYKALLKSINIPEEEKHHNITTFAQKQEAILKLKLSVINYCIRNLYVLQRWKTVVNVMLFKEPGNYKIHRLRVIHIYEADFNLILAVKWRKLLHFADRHNTINNGQYGGRPGCEAQSLTLLEELKYDASYLTRRSLFNFDNDASSCYDRIIVSLASLINRKYGMHQRVVSLHAATLREAKFRLKTAAGISDISYSHCPQFPIHGTGQGSGNSPSIWLFISSTLFDIHACKSFGATFISPDGDTKVNLSMVGFVDDSTGSCNDFRPNTQDPLPQLFDRMEHDAQLWNNLLYCSGGKLELSKCSFHVLHFDFESNGTPRPTIEKFEDRIHIRDSETNENIAISAKRAFETHKTLGHQKSPHTNTQPTLRYIQQKADRLSMLLAMSPVTRQGAHLAYHTIFIPSVKYSLPQSFYARRDLEKAQASSITKIIAKCGYNRNTARAIIYAPLQFAGGGFIPWYLLQGEGQVTQFIKHWRTNTIVSKMLQIVVKWAQWQSGHDRFLLEDTVTRIPHLECRWLRSLRDFLTSINARICLSNSLVATPEKHYDIYIMTYAQESGLFTEKELCIINYCRLYLHITTLSELLDPSGQWIITQLFDCQREPWFDSKTYITLQRRPTDYHIKYTWQRLCRQWVTTEGKLAASLSLGRWLTTGDKLRRRRQTYIRIADHQIYHWRYGKYWLYKPSAKHPKVYVPDIATLWEPTDACYPIQATENAGGHLVVVKSKNTAVAPARQIPPPKTFTAYVLNLQKWEQDLILGVTMNYEPFEILHRVSTCDTGQDLILVSDGSHRDQTITFGWTFGTADGTIYAEHSGAGYGTLSSHRAEAWGMLSGTVFLHHVLQYTYTSAFATPLKVLFYSDNNGLIQRVVHRFDYRESYPNSTLAADWDLIEQIYVTASQISTCTLQYKWVKGHQDDTTSELTTEAQYNIRADALAGSFTAQTKSNTPQQVLPSEKCCLHIGDRAIYGHYIYEIRQAYMLPPLRDYLAGWHKWSQGTESKIDWDAFQTAVRNCHIPHIQLVKLVHDKLPTRYEQAKSNPQGLKTCHYCTSDETFAHLLQCDNPISQRFREDLQHQLENYFIATQTPESFRKLVLQSQRLWYKPTPPETHQLDTPIERTYQEQQQIGWQLFLKGYISKEWRTQYQEACEMDEDSLPSNSTTGYLAGIIRVIWKAQTALWDAHLQHIHNAKTSTIPYKDKRNEYETRIRILHQHQHLCIFAHREQYFFPDVEAYLQQATLPQMKNYLFHYEPAILLSQKAAKKHPVKSLWTFPGFTRTRSTQEKPPVNDQNPPPRSMSRSNSNANKGDPIPHKHTRWKRISNTIRGIQEYFQKPPPA